ncbi:putative YhhN family protein [Blattamonas nauphoetae]|uniref:YhhN family protein n=1 Tax=Blattamonas nauphoetae TaxID=2049346 RepID=A0ABQ9YGI5_9EUKA|nr:putative YhhN family protein [Blattamonas nauphoetae]
MPTVLTFPYYIAVLAVAGTYVFFAQQENKQMMHLLKSIPIWMQIPLILFLWDHGKRRTVDPESPIKSNYHTFMALGSLMGGIGDQFMIHPDVRNSLVMGTVFFGLCHIAYIYAVWPSQPFKKSTLIVGTVISLMILLPIYWVLIQDMKDDILLMFGMGAYLVLETAATIMFFALPRNENCCERCYSVGRIGYVSFIVSDVVLFFHLFRHGLIPFGDPTVMFFYYMAQFFIAYSSRMYTCHHLHAEKEKE